MELKQTQKRKRKDENGPWTTWLPFLENKKLPSLTSLEGTIAENWDKCKIPKSLEEKRKEGLRREEKYLTSTQKVVGLFLNLLTPTIEDFKEKERIPVAKEAQILTWIQQHIKKSCELEETETGNEQGCDCLFCLIVSLLAAQLVLAKTRTIATKRQEGPVSWRKTDLMSFRPFWVSAAARTLGTGESRHDSDKPWGLNSKSWWFHTYFSPFSMIDTVLLESNHTVDREDFLELIENEVMDAWIPAKKELVSIATENNLIKLQEETKFKLDFLFNLKERKWVPI
jgi:hypothetical protein